LNFQRKASVKTEAFFYGEKLSVRVLCLQKFFSHLPAVALARASAGRDGADYAEMAQSVTGEIVCVSAVSAKNFLADGADYAEMAQRLFLML
jgi:hypothetical protein